MKNCEICDTSLEIDMPDGRTFAFTAHTMEFCRIAAVARVRMLETMVKRHVLEHAAYQQQCVELAGRVRDARDALECADNLLGLVSSALRVGEAVTATDLTRILATVRDGIAAASGTMRRDPVDQGALAEAKRQLEIGAFDQPSRTENESYLMSGGPQFSRAERLAAEARDRQRDLHHSQGVEVAEIIGGTPLGKACDCGAGVGVGCDDREPGGEWVDTEFGRFHSSRVQ